ncbi:flagellar biosynthetic protein FliR [Microbacterium sp. SYP-A9085]|uniref:flagellar biosynthetic protein FliR n=1 Tax=Microbacterium sp. SYP-A9085 TaxID=2664454 RepID=UPI00129A7473|nr:flagellar biosynthetic protein FliR [Microbacterium sp. SYP-A9085]MRH30067.1 flagellar biosynthetic protein FliR [Microbacterium sp. SYP-A9085]
MHIPVDVVWLEATMLAAVRITAFLFIAPPFSHGAIPARIKAMLGVGLALAVSGGVAPGHRSMDVAPFLGALALQLVVGALLGFLVMMCFSAIQAAGGLIDVFGGFQLAQVFDPQSQVNGAQFTRLFQMTALTLLFASGGYQLIIAGLTRSFDAVPVDGTFAVGAPAQLIVEGVSQMFVAAVQIAGPLILVLFLADVALGLVTRGAPALNAFALGLPVKLLLTLALAGTVFLVLPGILEALGTDAFRIMRSVGR